MTERIQNLVPRTLLGARCPRLFDGLCSPGPSWTEHTQSQVTGAVDDGVHRTLLSWRTPCGSLPESRHTCPPAYLVLEALCSHASTSAAVFRRKTRNNFAHCPGVRRHTASQAAGSCLGRQHFREKLERYHKFLPPPRSSQRRRKGQGRPSRPRPSGCEPHLFARQNCSKRGTCSSCRTATSHILDAPGSGGQESAEEERYGCTSCGSRPAAPAPDCAIGQSAGTDGCAPRPSTATRLGIVRPPKARLL